MSKLKRDKDGNYFQSGPKLREKQKEFWFEKQEAEKKSGGSGKTLWCKECKQSQPDWRFSATQKKKFPPTCLSCAKALELGVIVKQSNDQVDNIAV